MGSHKTAEMNSVLHPYKAAGRVANNTNKKSIATAIVISNTHTDNSVLTTDSSLASTMSYAYTTKQIQTFVSIDQ